MSNQSGTPADGSTEASENTPATDPTSSPNQAPPNAQGSAMGEAVSGLLKTFLRRGQSELDRFTHTSRNRLELRQLRRDRDVMYQKLGREVRNLIEGGELDPPGLKRGVERIREIESQLTQTILQPDDSGAAPVGTTDPTNPT